MLTRPPGLVTVREAAAALGLVESTIRAWILTRKIGYVKLGKAVRIPMAELERLVADGSRPATEGSAQG
jgi:excisionase family DNA binding protein